nr:MAG TPA: hypothetical protein [Caudoviricetes sp.]
MPVGGGGVPCFWWWYTVLVAQSLEVLLWLTCFLIVFRSRLLRW